MASDITFIIPTYNAAFHIERCLKSIRSQTYPNDKIEIIIADGGSSDNTLDLARKYNCRIIYNAKRLAEYGLQLGVHNATGAFLVPFAADNELVGNDWAQKVMGLFSAHKEISAVWGRLVSGRQDSFLNKYFELIQSDPLTWFLNKNLNIYKTRARIIGGDCFVFKVGPERPLAWGANGLAYKAENLKAVWAQAGYLGDNDAFQYMIEQGNNIVAYFDSPFVYHHHVAALRDWVRKWRRNYKLHFLDKLHTRNLNWVFLPHFNLRIGIWLFYSLCPVFSGLHAVYLAARKRNIHWLYHPLVCFLQTVVYACITLTTREGRGLLKEKICIS